MINTTTARAIDPQLHVRQLPEAQIEMVDAVDTQGRPWSAVLQVARKTGVALLGAWRMNSNPKYFELDRPWRAAVDLGAGVTWESDSFWAGGASTYQRG